MGLLHSIFGGGTELLLNVDNQVASLGSIIGGRIVLSGGAKPRQLTELIVKLCSVEMYTVEGESEPRVDIEVLESQRVAAGIQLAAGAKVPFTFRLRVPDDLEPSARLERTSYQVMATADIPGVVDPEANVQVTIVEASEHEARPLTLQEIVQLFPDLHSPDEERLCEALRGFYNACFNDGPQLMEGEQLIGYHMMNGTPRVRHLALQAWAHLVDNRVQPQHLHVLYSLANSPGLDEDMFTEVIVAAAKFAEEGALPLVQQLAVHPDPEVRERVAWNLYSRAAEKFPGKRELLLQLSQDASPAVRAEAVRGLSQFVDEQGLAQWLVQRAESDPEPEVQAAGIKALHLGSHHGLLDFSLAVYEKHLQNPHPLVRKEIAYGVSYIPADAVQRTAAIVQRLAQDPEESVRDALAEEFADMSDTPQLLPVVQYMAQHDPSPKVRRRALGSMGALMQPKEAAAYYGQCLAQARGEDDLWPIIYGLCEHARWPEVQPILSHIGQLPYPDIANAAREAMTMPAWRFRQQFRPW
ncbi:HEAT repeat domain-containing protein [Pendulispora brunnea]|uniref:HEAT repeat domain-containing protein n=1 Tax=Pendulispora brunnea TaxID=2905690 RepID=A0ABZ2KS69_9BACT